jgi:hypothetical protein
VIRHRSSLLAGFALVAVALAGCSGTSAGNPTPAASASSPVSSSPSYGAPSVRSPLPATVIAGSPCDTALTKANLEEFLGTGVGAPKPGEDETGLTCRWSNLDSGAGFTVAYQTKLDGGLRLAYKNAKPDAAHWEELQAIQGFPAIGYLASGEDPNDKGLCQVVVGISDTLSYAIGISLSQSAQANGREACGAGRDVADKVMTNIKGRA